MKNVVFGMPAQLCWQGEDVSAVWPGRSNRTDWNLGVAILYVINQGAELQHQFEIETEYSRLDHLAIQRLAESSLFQRWRQEQS